MIDPPIQPKNYHLLITNKYREGRVKKKFNKNIEIDIEI